MSLTIPSFSLLKRRSIIIGNNSNAGLFSMLYFSSESRKYSTRAHWYRVLHTTKDKSIYTLTLDSLKQKMADDLGNDSEEIINKIISNDPDWGNSEFRKWFVKDIIIPSAHVDNDPIAFVKTVRSITSFKRDFGVQRLMTAYNESFLKLMEEVYPETNWVEQIPFKLWNPEEIEERATDVANYIEKILNIRSKNDWGNISSKEFSELGLKKLGEKDYRVEFLSKAYPEQSWSEEEFNRPVRKSHRRLVSVVRDTFPNYELQEEVHLSIKFNNEPILLEADIYIPDLHLALDYRGPQHYHDTRGAFMQVEGAMRKDQLKRETFTQNGIDLIEIPYWWNESADQLQATIKKARPDLISNVSVEPIPEYPPEKRSTSLHLMEPEFWDGKQNLSNYLVTEKLDGVRCTIENGILLNRKQNQLTIPENLEAELKNATSKCTNIVFDAELICSQGYEKLNALLTKSRKDSIRDADWEDVRIRIFDVVDEEKTIEERIDILKRVEDQNNVSTLKHEQIRDNEDANNRLKEIVAKGGEGLICIRPNSKYFIGRTRSMIKIKPFYDQEVLYLGKADKSISFDVELISGQRIKARTTWGDYTRTDLVPGKTVLTICFTQIHHSTGKPFQPTVLRERLDMNWEELKEKYQKVGDDKSLIRSSSLAQKFEDELKKLNIVPSTFTPKSRYEFFEQHYSSEDLYPSPEVKQAIASVFEISFDEVGLMLQKLRLLKRKEPQEEV